MRAMRDLLVDRRERINDKWTGLDGPDLYRKQGEAKLVRELLRVIDAGPGIKPAERSE